MFDFLKRKKNTLMAKPVEIKHYTAEDVTAELTATMMIMLEELREYVEYKNDSKSRSQLFRLNNLGLFNTQNAKLEQLRQDEIAEYNKKVDTLKLMNKAWHTFGNDVMIVSYFKFMEIMEKYDLVCGDLSRYTGAIPEKNLAEIERVKSMNDSNMIDSQFAENLRRVSSISFHSDNHTNEDLIKRARFPFTYNEAEKEMGIKIGRRFDDFNSLIDCQTHLAMSVNGTIERVPYFNDRFFLCAPVEEMTPIKFYINISLGDRRADSIVTEFKSLKKYCDLVVTKDPFFCSCTPYGVLIYSKWGDEAQDEIIKRYEELSKTING